MAGNATVRVPGRLISGANSVRTPSSHRQDLHRHVPGGRIRARWEGSQPHQPAGVSDLNVVSNYRVTRSAAPRGPRIRLERSNSGGLEAVIICRALMAFSGQLQPRISAPKSAAKSR